MENKMAAKKNAVPAKKVATKKVATATKKVAPKGEASKKTGKPVKSAQLKGNAKDGDKDGFVQDGTTQERRKPGRPQNKPASKSPAKTTATDKGFTISVSTPGINPIAMPSNSTSTNATGSVPGIDVMAAVLAATPKHAKKSILKRLFGVFKRSSKR